MEFLGSVLENLKTLSETLVWILFSDSAMIKDWTVGKIKQDMDSKDKLSKVLNTVPKSITCNGINEFDFDEHSLLDNNTGIATLTVDQLWKRPGKNMSGKWLCVINYEELYQKDRQNLANYLKAPNKNVLLIITVSDFRNIIFFRQNFNKLYEHSEKIHAIKLQYPSRRMLCTITNQLFTGYNIKLTEEQQNMFVMKMGSAYDEYKDCVTKVALRLGATDEQSADTPFIEVINKDFSIATKGIDHFEINDLLKCMTQPITSSKTLNGRRTVHKITAMLLTNLTAKELVKRLKYRVQDMIVYRSAINSGIIPIKVPYNVSQVQEKLEENLINAKIKKASAYAFKKNALIANMTSIEDWFYLYSILDIPDYSTDEQYMKALLSAINRTALSTDRLMNCAHIKNTLDENLVTLNGILYTPWWESLDTVSD